MHRCDAQDEEDEELVRKARANRAAKLAEQRQTTRSFMEVRVRVQHQSGGGVVCSSSST